MKNKSLTPIIVFIVIIIFVVAIIYNINRINKEAENSTMDKNSSIQDITLESNKINIYLFWGNGCEHCKELFSFFEEIAPEYSKYYNIYAFEVWNNEENGKLMDEFGEILNDDTKKRSVPYFIIGDKSYSGYSASLDEEIKNTIIEKYNNKDNINKFEDIINKN